jgi:hypothetical protein
VFAELAHAEGRFFVVLVDQPIGDTAGIPKSYRDVERAFTNSTRILNAKTVIQAPKFQPGAEHAARGLEQARAALRLLGHAQTRVIESFPQLSVLPLVAFAIQASLPTDAVTGLAAHKSGRLPTVAARQLVDAFCAWSGRLVLGPAREGHPDAVDALLALLPALDVPAPTNRVTPPPVWLHAAPPGAPAHPSTVRRRLKADARAQWMSRLTPQALGPVGIRTDGILALQQPGWPSPAGDPRAL